MLSQSTLSLNQDSFFKNKVDGPLPKPPIFKHGFNSRPFTVPSFYPFEHSETTWIINILRSHNWVRLERLALINPNYFVTSYFQLPDNPNSVNGRPMLHSKAIIYLNIFGLTLYFNSSLILKNLLNFCLSDSSHLIDTNQPCFATNVFIKSGGKINDLLQLNPLSILVLRESFDCIEPMIHYGKWLPLRQFYFLYRRPFKMCKFVYRDIIEYCLSQLITKTSLRLPHLFNCLINCFSESFSLLYYEQIQIQYGDIEIEEWVSIPRRLLRFGFYFDKDLRLASQLIRCVSIFQLHSFFFGPTKSCYEIYYQNRINFLKTNFDSKECNSELSRVIMDQDHCIALLLGMLEHATSFHYNIPKEKILSLFPQLLFDTKWLLHFVIKKPFELINYFQSLLEKIGDISELSIKLVKREIVVNILNGVIPIYTIRELNLKPNQIVNSEKVMHDFAHKYRHYMGVSLINDNNHKRNCGDNFISDKSSISKVKQVLNLLENENL